MKTRCVSQRSVTSHRSQVSTKTCPGDVSYQLASVHSNHLCQPAMASNSRIAIPNVKAACVVTV
jgi:hypothetical protein